MLKYIGGGILAGVPARDLNDDEVKRYGKKRLLDSGLYEQKRERKPREIEQPATVEQVEE